MRRIVTFLLCALPIVAQLSDQGPRNGVLIQSNLQALYLLRGNANDSGPNGYNCTVANAISYLPYQGATFNVSSQLDCPTAAFNGAGTIMIWMKPSYMDGSSNRILYSSTGSQIQIAEGKLAVYAGATIPNLIADRLEGNMSFAYIPSTGASYINGAAGLGSIEAATTFSYAASVASHIGLSTQTFTGNIYAIAVYSSALTAAQIAQNDAAMWKTLANGGVLPFGKNTGRGLTVAIGDSLTQPYDASTQGTISESYLMQGAKILGYDRNYYNMGQSGQTCAQMVANYQVYNNLLTNYVSGAAPAPPLVSVECGINDISANTTAATVFGYMQTLASNVHTSNPLAKELTMTVGPNGGWNGTQKTTWGTVNSDIYSGWLAGTLNADGVIDVANDPIMGDINLVSNTTWYGGDSLHPNQAGYAIYAKRWALANCLLQGGTPCQLQVQVPYQKFVADSDASTSATINLLQLGPGQQVCGVSENVPTAFSGTTTLTMSLGDSTGSATSYLAAQNMMSTGRTIAQSPNFASTNGIVQATFTSTGSNLSALAAGAVNVDLCVVSAP